MKAIDLQKRQQSHRPLTCAPDGTLEYAAKLMAEANIGALPVTDRDGNVLGMLSERDVSRAVADRGSDASKLRVEEVMSRDVASCAAGDSVRGAMLTMSSRGVRHLPILADGLLVGVISQRDVLGALLEDAQLEVGVLRDVARTRV